MMVNKQDIVLLLEVLRQNNIESKKMLHNIIYTLKHRCEIPFTFNFRQYFNGPYSHELAEVIQSLVSMGLIREDIEHLDNKIQYKYSITKKGEDFINVQGIDKHFINIEKFLVS